MIAALNGYAGEVESLSSRISVLENLAESQSTTIQTLHSSVVSLNSSITQLIAAVQHARTERPSAAPAEAEVLSAAPA